MPTRSRDFYLEKADTVLSKASFTREDDALVRSLQAQAGLVGVQPGNGHRYEDPELRRWEYAIRKLRPGQQGIIDWTPLEHRDMKIATGSGGGYFVPAGFREQVETAMRQYDQLFDRDVVTYFEMERGGPVMLPSLDDTTISAVIVSEGVLSPEADPTAGGVQLGNASTWRSGKVVVSVELLRDAGFPIADLLAAAFGVRFARGVGASLVGTLLAGATLGATATGDPNKTGATGTNSIGYQDLLALRVSVDAAYRASPKCFFAMNDNTLASIDGWLDKNNRPIIRPQFDANGRRLLLGYKVALCPSLPDIAPGATPILFGAMDYLILRTVPQGTTLQSYTEAPGYAENGLVGFQGFFRANAGLLNANSSSPPVKYLQNGS
jgi:HK97 family phage major capsid protein